MRGVEAVSTIESPVFVLDPQVAIVQATEPQRSKVAVQIPSAISSRPTYSPRQTVETFTQRRFHRMSQFALTYRTSTRSGYSSLEVFHSPHDMGMRQASPRVG